MKKIFIAILVMMIKAIANIVGKVHEFAGRGDYVKNLVLYVAEQVENKMDEDRDVVVQNINAAIDRIKDDDRTYKSINATNRYYSSNNWNYDDSLADRFRKWAQHISTEIFCWAVVVFAFAIAILITVIIVLIIKPF